MNLKKSLLKCSLGLVMHVTEQLKMIENVLKVFCSVRFYGCVRIGWKFVSEDSICEEGELV